MFIIPPGVHNELKGKSPAEFFEAIEAHVLTGMHILFYRYYRSTNPWEPYYRDVRRNPYHSHDQHGMIDDETILVPGQLTLFGDNERCNQWAKGKPMKPLNEM